jgi:hypothetical protein
MIDTANYYHAAYIIAAVLYVSYGLSLVLRRRRVLARLAALERGADR